MGSSRVTATSTSSTSASTTMLKTYTEAHFRLTYPSNWLAQGSGNQMMFQDAQGLNALTIIITPNPGGLKSADSLADTTFPLIAKAILTNPQSIHFSPIATVASETWAQRGATGTLSTDAQSMPGKLLLLIDNHPVNSPATQAYEIYYGGPAATFDQIDHADFQAMLRSFTFKV